MHNPVCTEDNERVRLRKDINHRDSTNWDSVRHSNGLRKVKAQCAPIILVPVIVEIVQYSEAAAKVVMLSPIASGVVDMRSIARAAACEHLDLKLSATGYLEGRPILRGSFRMF